MFPLFFADTEGGAFNLNELFENNVINWIVLVAIIVWLVLKIVPPILKARKEQIETALEIAEKAKLEGATFLAEQRERIANAEEEAAKILDESKQVAREMSLQIERQTEQELKTLSTKFDHAIANERQLVITQLREASVKVAIALAEAQLSQAVSQQSQAQKDQLVTQFMEQLDSVVAQPVGEKVGRGKLESIH